MANPGVIRPAIPAIGYKTVLFERFMTPTFLVGNVEWNCEHELQDKTHLFIKKDRIEYERIFRLKVVDRIYLGKNKLLDFDFSLCVGLEYTGTRAVRDPLTWSVANNRDRAIGIQLRDITEYRTLGPYVGVEGDPGRALEHYGLTGQEQAETSTSTHWPRVFNIDLKPLEKTGYCWTAIDTGHLFSCEFDPYNPTIDPTKDDIYLDVYRFKDAETYNINFVKLTITMHTEKEYMP